MRAVTERAEQATVYIFTQEIIYEKEVGEFCFELGGMFFAEMSRLYPCQNVHKNFMVFHYYQDFSLIFEHTY